jgi:hypothetical protein
LLAILTPLLLVSGQGPHSITDSVRQRLFVQGELTWYGAGRVEDLSNRVVRIQAIKRLGFGGTRLPVEWVAVEGIRGRRDWSRLDSTVAELKRYGVEAYGLLAYSPKWAVPQAIATSPASLRHRPVVDNSIEKGDTLFAAFAAAAARRYRGFIDRWEVWNEENLPFFWMNVEAGRNQKPDPGDYAHFFRLARDSILAANHQAQVAIGGLSSLDGRVGDFMDPFDSTRRLAALPPEQYLRALVKVGVKFDAVGLHPYSMVPPRVASLGRGIIFPDVVVDSVLAALRGLGMSGVRVWITEWGVHAPFVRSQSALDSWYRDALGILLCKPEIDFVTIHTLMDVNSADHFGLLNLDGTETLNGVSFKNWLSVWDGCRWK